MTLEKLETWIHKLRKIYGDKAETNVDHITVDDAEKSQPKITLKTNVISKGL